jgi:hypothetical protein
MSDNFTKMEIHLSHKTVTSSAALAEIEFNPQLYQILDYRDREKYQQYLEHLQNGGHNQQKLRSSV